MLDHVHMLQLELEYCCVKSTNRRTGKSMNRVCVHGKFQKPFDAILHNFVHLGMIFFSNEDFVFLLYSL